MMKNKTRLYMVSLTLSVVATALGAGTMGVMLNAIVSSYSLASAQEGLMSSCISAGALAALIIGILLRSRVRKPQFIAAGGLLMSLMLLAQSIPVSFFVFLLLCVVMGLGMGVLDSFQSAFVTDLEPEHTAKCLGALHGIFGIGGLATPLIVQKLLGMFSWRTVYFLIGAFCLTLLMQFVVVASLMKGSVACAGRLEQAQSFQQLWKFVKNPYFVLLLLCMLFGAAGQNGILVWTIRYVSVTLQSPETAAVCLSVYWMTSTVSRFFAPYLPLRPARILSVGALISGAAWACGVAAGTPQTMCLACAVAGLTSGCCIPLALNEGAAFSRENTGLVTSMLMIVKTVGQVLTPILIASVNAACGMRTAVLVIAALFGTDAVVAGLMIYCAPGKKKAEA